MKVNGLLIAALATLTFAACSNDDTGNGNTPVVENGEPTVVKITLTQSSGTYGAPVNASQPTDDESRINDATLYVFNANRNLEQAVTLTPSGSGNNWTATKVFETTTGTHYFYATINIPSSKIGAVPVGTSLESFEKRLMAISSLNDLTDAGEGFWMTNVTKPAGVNLVKATEAEATAETYNHVIVGVGRASVKVNLEFAPEEQYYGQLSGVSYKVVNNPNQMYLMPIYDGSILKTPYFNDATVTTSKYLNGTYNNEGTASYGVENSNAEPKEGNASMVIVRGTFLPNAWKDANGDKDNTSYTAGQTFWRIANMENGVIVDYTDDYYSDEPDDSLIGSDQAKVEYPDGICYYPIWLANSNVIGDAVSKYSVKRNSYYWITITSVFGAGASDEEEVVVDPEIPLEDETWMKGRIEILPWEVINLSTGI